MRWKRKPEVVYVEWEDSCTTYGWRPREGNATSMIRSVGIVVERNPKTLTLSTSENDECSRYVDQIAIPMSAVRTLRKVRV